MLDSYAYKPPVVKKESREDKIPDLPQNKAVRDFLKKAPPEAAAHAFGGVVLSQCRRCKVYGHESGSKECPYFLTGNIESEAERQIREDPMAPMVGLREVGKTVSKKEKLEQLNQLLASVHEEERKRKDKKEKKRDKKQKDKKKKKKKKLKTEQHE